ncbi:unnamed protein product [Lepeophtheirus salmonis]|uniref:(salmon louse) hypothetical protein n=1 Tax=Lepeophtheirus salmonis TaxID=72036 RepID=A0A7R8H4M0_LEPSM|nr:unnamed protein product [Lepeophtheirus salmonis]CAF2848948.1 unnamed protein product [Lepeophtheirus salmonis]
MHCSSKYLIEEIDNLINEERALDEKNRGTVVHTHDWIVMYSRNIIGERSNGWSIGIVPKTINSKFSESPVQVILDSLKHIKDREREAVTISFCGNIDIDEYDNYYNGLRASTFRLVFAYSSVMHYGLNFFSKHRQD